MREFETRVGSISDFRSIRFMRLYSEGLDSAGYSEVYEDGTYLW